MLKTKSLFIAMSILLMFITTSCLSNLKAELKQNREKWSVNQFKNYQYDLEPIYFAPIIYLYEYPLTVTVQNNVPISIKDANGEELTTEYKNEIEKFSTIDNIFVFTEKTIGINPDRLEIQYDVVYGYPTLVDIYYDINWTDNGTTLKITNFKFSE
jgi:hypothetical protein